MEYIKRFTAETLVTVFGGTVILVLMIVFIPLVSFNTDSYEQVSAAAARIYGIDADEYIVEFKDKLTNAQGKTVQGFYSGYKCEGSHKTYIIQIRKQPVRVYTIGTIFHEFAHAAQDKYELPRGKYNREQHAEILCFSTMMKCRYWWEGLHLLSLHTFFSKPVSYRAPAELWQIALTGTSTITLL